MHKWGAEFCLLLSLLLTAQGVLAAALGADSIAPPSREIMPHCSAADGTTAGHSTPQSCCSDQLGCPLMQAQLPTLPAVGLQFVPTSTSIPDLATSPPCAGATAPPLRPPIPLSA